MIPLSWFLILSGGLFSIGLFGILTRRNAVAVVMSIELMMNAVNINLLAFWRYLHLPAVEGLVFVTIVFVVAAAETAVGLALIVSEYRNRQTVLVEEMNLLKG